jgi:hypothetical protein
MWKSTTSQINACRSGAFPTMVKEDEEAQDMCLAFDNDFTIKEDDCIFMAMV